MATTTNYGWTTPDDTALVKDGASAIRTLGSSVDTTTKALNPSTTLGDIEYRSATANTNTRLAIGSTGQILSVVAGVPAWVANDVGDITAVTAGTGISGGGTTGAVTITNDMATTITAAGDIVVGTGSGTYDNLPIGTTNQVLTADTTVSPYKVKWATPAGGGSTFAGAKIYRTSTQSIANATATAVQFDAESFDTDGYHDNVTNNTRFTIPSGKGGYYLLTSNIRYGNNATGGRSIDFYKNGSRIAGSYLPTISGSSVAYSASTVINGAVADYFEVYVYQDSGGSLNITSGDDTVLATISYLGA